MKHPNLIAFAIVGAALCSGGAAPLVAQQPIGPGFDCAKAMQPLARMICSSPELSRTDLLFNQAYQALRQQLDPAGKRQLAQDDLEFLDYVKRFCGVPDTGAVTGSPDCVAAQYERQREQWLRRLTGPALQEATRPIERHIALQAQLQQLDLLPPNAKVDGVYSVATREAIFEWQNDQGRPVTGFMSDADAAVFGTAESHLVSGLVPVAPRPTPANNLSPVPPPRSSSDYTSADRAEINLWATVIGILLLVFVTVFLAFLVVQRQKKQQANHQQQIIANLSRIIKDTVSLHARALCRKRFQILRDDEYGNRDLRTMAPWQTEIGYFLNTVLIPSIRDMEERDVFFQHIKPRAVELIYRLIEEEVERIGNITFGPNFSPVDFENFCAEQLRTAGWQAHTTKASGDQGSDVIAEKGGRRLVIQCKLYNYPVGNKAVQEVAAARVHEQGDYAAVVTNSRYTSAARQLAATNGILLLHHSDLRDIDGLLESQ